MDKITKCESTELSFYSLTSTYYKMKVISLELLKVVSFEKINRVVSPRSQSVSRTMNISIKNDRLEVIPVALRSRCLVLNFPTNVILHFNGKQTRETFCSCDNVGGKEVREGDWWPNLTRERGKNCYVLQFF